MTIDCGTRDARGVFRTMIRLNISAFFQKHLLYKKKRLSLQGKLIVNP